jgi:hypothetical protein
LTEREGEPWCGQPSIPEYRGALPAANQKTLSSLLMEFIEPKISTGVDIY